MEGFRVNVEKEYKLAMDYYTGNGVEKNYRKAVELLTKIAKKGHVEAQYWLGDYYHEHATMGEYIQSLNDNGEWWALAANNGHIDAQNRLLNDIRKNGPESAMRELEKMWWYKEAVNRIL